MNKVFIAFVLLCALSLACGTAAPAERTAEDYVNEFGGNVEVYRTILALSDCDALQEQFDTAYENSLRDAGTPKFSWSKGYMTAADDRMKAIGCYGEAQ